MKTTNNPFKTRTEMRKEVIRLGLQGLLLSEIAEELNVTKEFVAETFNQWRKNNPDKLI